MKPSSAPPPPSLEGRPDNTLAHLIRNAELAPRRTVMLRRHYSRWEPVNFGQFHDEVRQVAKGLAAAGTQPGDRVAVVSANRYERTVAEYAIWQAGAVAVEVCETSPPEEWEWILSDTGSVGVFASPLLREGVCRVADRLSGIRGVWTLDAAGLEWLTESGEVVGDDDLDHRGRAAGIAAISYTSGTTGRPRGCMLTHQDLRSQVAALVGRLPQVFSPDGSTALVLPTSHIMGLVTQLSCVYSGTVFAHPEQHRLLPDLEEIHPTFLVSWPDSLRSLSWTPGSRGGFASLGAVAPLLGPLLRRRIGAGLGDRLDHVLVGGGPVDPHFANELRACGVEVLNGYAVTECAGFVTVSLPGQDPTGDAGTAIGGAAVRIDSSGEVHARGPHRFAGYWNDPAATAAAVDEAGWVHTADVGSLGNEGRLSIVGRQQDLVAEFGGRTTDLRRIEARLDTHRLVARSLVTGSSAGGLKAVFTLDRAEVLHWAAGGRHSEADLRMALQNLVETTNRSLRKAATISSFEVRRETWTEAGGALSRSGALRRTAILSRKTIDLRSPASQRA